MFAHTYTLLYLLYVVASLGIISISLFYRCVLFMNVIFFHDLSLVMSCHVMLCYIDLRYIKLHVKLSYT